MLRPHYSNTELALSRHYNEIRDRLNNPQSPKNDQPIAIKHPRGVTGREAADIAQVRSAEAKVARLEALILRLREKIEEIEFPATARQNKWPANFIDTIKKSVCKEFHLTTNDLDSARRSSDLVIPRHMAMYLVKVLTIKSLPEIASKFGNRDHTTALAGIRKNEKRMLENKDICQVTVELQMKLEYGLFEWRHEK